MMRSKYRNKKTLVDNIWFDSKKESDRYLELKLLERAGEIFDLKLQPKFPIEIGGVKICTYIADFEYQEQGNPYKTIEDVKGMLTPIYRLKKKLMRAVHGVEILET